MSRIRTHYEVLGVRSNATSSEIRQAHHSLARMLHPDRLVTVRLTPEDRALADVRIREVNEAWRVLGDVGRRARYDATLGNSLQYGVSGEPWSPFPPGTPDDVTDWVSMPGPHWRPRGDEKVRVVDRRSPSPRPFHPTILIAFGIMVLLGVLLVVLLAGQGGRGGLPVAVTTGRCVRISAGPSTVQVPCSAPNDGRVVGFVEQGSDCPAGSSVRRLESDDSELACLSPASRHSTQGTSP